MAAGELSGIGVEVLDYQTGSIKEFAQQMTMEKAKQMHPGYELDQELCTQCGTCRDNCPAGAISLDPVPVISADCFVCNNCARLCPEGAMTTDTSGKEKRILDMQQQFAEDKGIQLFS